MSLTSANCASGEITNHLNAQIVLFVVSDYPFNCMEFSAISDFSIISLENLMAAMAYPFPYEDFVYFSPVENIQKDKDNSPSPKTSGLQRSRSTTRVKELQSPRELERLFFLLPPPEKVKKAIEAEAKEKEEQEQKQRSAVRRSASAENWLRESAHRSIPERFSTCFNKGLFDENTVITSPFLVEPKEDPQEAMKLALEKRALRRATLPPTPPKK